MTDYEAIIDRLLERFKSYRGIEHETGLSYGCLYALHNGWTKNPSIGTHNALIHAVNKMDKGGKK